MPGHTWSRSPPAQPMRPQPGAAAAAPAARTMCEQPDGCKALPLSEPSQLLTASMSQQTEPIKR